MVIVMKPTLMQCFPDPLSWQWPSTANPVMCECRQLYTLVAVCCCLPKTHLLVLCDVQESNVLSSMPKGPKYVDFTITSHTSSNDLISFLCRAESASTGLNTNALSSSPTSAAVAAGGGGATLTSSSSVPREVEMENNNNKSSNKKQSTNINSSASLKLARTNTNNSSNAHAVATSSNNSDTDKYKQINKTNNNYNTNKNNYHSRKYEETASSSVVALHKPISNTFYDYATSNTTSSTGPKPPSSSISPTTNTSNAVVVIVCLYGIAHASPSVLSTLMDVLTFEQVSLSNGKAAALPSLRIVAFCDYRHAALILPVYVRSAFALSMYMSSLAMESVAVLQSTDLLTSNVVNRRHMMMLMTLTNSNNSNTTFPHPSSNDVSMTSHTRADVTEYKYKLIDSVTMSSSVARYLRHLLVVISGSMYTAKVVGTHLLPRLPHLYRILKVLALLFDPDKNVEDVWSMYGGSSNTINQYSTSWNGVASQSNQNSSLSASPMTPPQGQQFTAHKQYNENGSIDDSVHTTPSTMAAAPVMSMKGKTKRMNALEQLRLTNRVMLTYEFEEFSHIIVSPSDVISLLSSFCTHVLTLSRYELPGNDIIQALLCQAGNVGTVNAPIKGGIGTLPSSSLSPRVMDSRFNQESLCTFNSSSNAHVMSEEHDNTLIATSSTHNREGNLNYSNNDTNSEININIQERNNSTTKVNTASDVNNNKKRVKPNDECNTTQENKTQNNVGNDGEVDRANVPMYDSANNNQSNDSDKRKGTTNVINTNTTMNTQIQLPEMYAVHRPIFNDHSTWDIRAANGQSHAFNKRPALQRAKELLETSVYYDTHSNNSHFRPQNYNSPYSGSALNNTATMYGKYPTRISHSAQSDHVPSYSVKMQGTSDVLNYCETREVICATLLCRSSPAPG